MSALKGLKVLDFGRWISAPYCTAILADLGAEVLKIESPTGDPTRAIGGGTFSHYFAHYNRNKSSETVDFQDAEDMSFLWDLIASADVLVENFRPGVMNSLGFGHDEVQLANERIIYASISGFGMGNPYSGRPAFNAIVEASSGLMDINGSPSSGPMATGNFATDHATGLHASTAILAAVIERQASGLGQHIDISMFDVAIASLGPRLTASMNGSPITTSMGNRDSTSAPGNVFATRDGQTIYIDAGTPAHFRNLQAAIGSAAIGNHEVFGSPELRWQNVDLLESTIETWTASMNADGIAKILTEHAVPHAVVALMPEVTKHPLLTARRMKVAVDTEAGIYKVPGAVAKMSRTPCADPSAPPALRPTGESRRARFRVPL